MKHDPQNPYQSFMVEASAGTGKTYQLTQRFLFLVGAGAEPGHILAITFTVKAVQEMHSRIIHEASRLLVDETLQKNFTLKLNKFYKNFLASQDENFKIPEPRTAIQTAKIILASTQHLKISTIDSIFYEWVTRFPSEANIDASGTPVFERSVNLTETVDSEDLSKKAWDGIFKENELRKEFFNHYHKIQHLLPGAGLLGIQKQTEELFRYLLHIFYLQKQGSSVFLAYNNSSENKVNADEQSFLKDIEEDLFTLAHQITKKDPIIDAIKQRSLDALVNSRFLTQSFAVSKVMLKGAKRQAVSSVIQDLEEKLQNYFNEKSKAELQTIGQGLFSIYQLWYRARQNLKQKKRSYEFSDLSMGCYNLFSSEENTSVLWLLQKSIHHVLIDEFQDTSMVQWEVFSKILEEIISGFEDNTNKEGYRTAFVVGDRKQSIYGFREADPYVMDLAADFFQHYKSKIVSLNKSYRTTPLIMDFISQFFTDEIDANFPRHQTAMDDQGQFVIPNQSKIHLSPLFGSDVEDSKMPVELEAEALANYLAEVFAHPENYPIYDKKKKCYRKIRYQDCCVLYRNATHADIFIEALEQKKIPYKKENENSFFDRNEIKSTIALLRFFVDSSDIQSLLIFLRAGFLDLPESIIIEVLDLTRTSEPSDRADLICSLLQDKGFDLQKILHLKGDKAYYAPHELLLSLYELVFYKKDDQNLELVASREKSLIKLIDLVVDLGHKGFNTLPELVRELDRIAEHKIQSADDSSQDSVALMTIHKSKGLEFPLVALIETADSWFKFDRYWLKSTEGLYYCGTAAKMPKEDKKFRKVYEQTEASMFEETIRLLYVALTRTSQYLYISAHKVRSSKAMGFYSLLSKSLKQVPNVCEFKGALVLESKAQKLNYGSHLEKSPTIEPSDDKIIFHKKAKEYKILTPHSLLAYEKEEGVKKNSLKLSEDMKALLGTFVHKAFELFFKKSKVPLEVVWKRLVLNDPVFLKENFSSTQAKELFDQTQKEINQSLKSEEFNQLFAGSLQIIPEMPLVQKHGSFLTLGTVDLFVQQSENKFLILDYKTSECSKEESLKDFCQQRSYHKQLLSYRQILSSVYPGSNIEAAIWLTKVQKAIFF